MSDQKFLNSLGEAGYLALGELIIQITQADELRDLFEAVARHVPRILVADRASVALLGPSGEEAEVFALEGTEGAVPRGHKLPVGRTLIGEVLARNRTTAWDVSEVRAHYVDADALSRHGVRWIINAPLQGTEGLIGTINVCSRSATPYRDDDISLLNQVASLVSATLGRQHLLASTRAAADRSQAYAEKLEVLNSIAHRLSTAMSEREMFSIVSEAVSLMVPHDRASLAILQDDESSCRVTMLSGDGASMGQGALVPLEGSGLGEVFRSGESVYWPDFSSTAHRDHAQLRERGLTAGISIPITRGGRTWATLNLACERRNPFTAEDRAVLVMLARLMSTTLDRVHIAEQLDDQARRDPLTRLANRREFDRVLAQAVDEVRVSGEPTSLCYIDIDHFKTINDSFGHHAGDVLLKDVVERMCSVLPRTDTLARVGGDEFALLLRGCRLPDAVRVAERLRQAVGSHVSLVDEEHISVTLSIGIGEIDGEGTVAEAISDADAACYLSKEGGRNRVTVAREQKHLVLRRRGEAQEVNLIKRAVAAGAFMVHAQPVWALPELEVVAYEMLVRLADEDGTLVSPGRFIPIAERYGLITGIDTWMFEQVVRWVSSGLGAQCQQVCTINISSTSLESDEFLQQVLGALRDGTVPPERLGFEITERVAVSQVAKASRFIEALSSLGCRFALDDFGSGFSSFGALKSLRVDYIKIDGSLVRDVADDAVDRAAVRAIADLAAALEASTIAEFVEDPATVEILHELGVTHAQGYGLGRPVPLEALEVPAPAAARLRLA